MQGNQLTPEQAIAELKIRFFDFREQAEARLAQMDGILRAIFETAQVQSVEEVLELLKKEEPEEINEEPEKAE